MLDVETIESNWKKFEKLCVRLCDSNLDNLLEALGERIVMCPAESRTDQYGYYPGGLVEHALDVTIAMRTLSNAFDMDIPVSSILKVGLLHDLGKVGGLVEDRFVEQDSDWHREKLGQNYKFNESLRKMSVSHRTLFLLQHFGVSLAEDEWLAIQLAQGSHFEENRFYVGHEPKLGLILQQSKSLVTHREK